MYPKISDFFNDIFGTNIVLPIQSFGFFVALAFLTAFWVLGKEFRRVMALGLVPVRVEKQTTGPLPIWDVLLNVVLFGFLGGKLGLLFSDWGHYASHPQEMLSPLWSFYPVGLLVGAGLAAIVKGWEFWQAKDLPIVEKEVKVSLPEDSGAMFTLAFVFGILGAKLFHAFEYWDDFKQDPIGMLSSFDGLTFYGGLLCAAVVIVLYVRYKGYNILTVADAVTPSLLMAYGIGRMGCHIAGDGDWGIVNPHPNPGLPDWLWSYTYPHNVIQDGTVKIPGCVGEYCNQLAEGVYPTPLYEFLLCLALFGILFWLRKKLPYMGQLTGLYLIFNGLERFLIEKIRVNVQIDVLGLFKATQAELISAGLIIFGIVLFVLATVKWKQNNPEVKPTSVA